MNVYNIIVRYSCELLLFCWQPAETTGAVGSTSAGSSGATASKPVEVVRYCLLFFTAGTYNPQITRHGGSPQADLGIHIWGGKLFRGPVGRERGWDQLGVWGSTVSSPSGIWVGADIEFGAFLAAKSDIRWQQFRYFSEIKLTPFARLNSKDKSRESKIFGEAMPPLACD